MDTNKLFTIAGAFVITGAGVAAIRAYADASAATLLHSPAAEAQLIQTLPTITVRPSRADIEAARHGTAPVIFKDTSASVSGGGFVFDMPYYSFAVKSTRVGQG